MRVLTFGKSCYTLGWGYVKNAKHVVLFSNFTLLLECDGVTVGQQGSSCILTVETTL